MKLTKADVDLLEAGLAAYLAADREAGLSFARDHYLVTGADGKPAYFQGDWGALLAHCASTPGGKPQWLTTYERTELDAKAVIAKLRAQLAPKKK